MTQREFDPLALDVPAFCADQASLAGAWPAQAMARLQEDAPPEAPSAPDVQWKVRGEARAITGADVPERWLHIEATAAPWFECQCCLKPVQLPIEINTQLQFVESEEEAEKLDADAEHDVLVLSKALNLCELVEDELVLSLPVIPAHDECPDPLLRPDAPWLAPTGEVDELEDPPHPFAALAALKKTPKA